MKRRFRHGVELTDRQFAEQEWARGQLEFRGGTLYLSESGVDGKPPPYGILYRPTLKACYSDSISFAGIELDGRLWVAQVWFCEVSRSDGI